MLLIIKHERGLDIGGRYSIDLTANEYIFEPYILLFLGNDNFRIPELKSQIKKIDRKRDTCKLVVAKFDLQIMRL